MQYAVSDLRNQWVSSFPAGEAEYSLITDSPALWLKRLDCVIALVKQRQVYSPVAETLISVKRLKKTELEELSSVCLTRHWAVNLKILPFLSDNCSTAPWLRPNGEAALNTVWWFLKRKIRLAVEIHSQADGVAAPEQPMNRWWSNRWFHMNENWYYLDSVVTCWCFIFSRYGKRSTPEQAMAWLLFGADSNQEAEPRWEKHIWFQWKDTDFILKCVPKKEDGGNSSVLPEERMMPLLNIKSSFNL